MYCHVLRNKGEAVLVAPPHEVVKRKNELLSRYEAHEEDLDIHEASRCGGCGSSYADEMEALSCPCHDGF